MSGGNGEISEAIEQLREQLTSVQANSDDARLRFAVAEVEMEFLVEVTKGGGGSGGLRLGLVSAAADGRVTKGTSHRLRLKLEVTDNKTGGRATISDRR